MCKMIFDNKKLVFKLVASFLTFYMLLSYISSYTYAKILDEDVDWSETNRPAIELRIVEIKDVVNVDGTIDKQVIALLKAYNMELSSLDINLTYDSNIIKPSDINTNEYTDFFYKNTTEIIDSKYSEWEVDADYEEDITHWSLSAASTEEDDYSNNIDLEWMKNLPDWLQWILGVYIPESDGNTNVHEDEYYSSIICRRRRYNPS